MIQKVFTIYDTKAAVFTQPFFALTTAAGIRVCVDLVNDPNTMIGRHYADYVLYEVGTWDDQAGLLTPAEAQSLGPCTQWLRVELPPQLHQAAPASNGRAAQ